MSTRDEPENPTRHDTDQKREWATPSHQPPVPYKGDRPATRPSSEPLETDELVAVIAALIPGLGQLIMGQTAKGVMLMIIALFTACVGGLVSVASVVDAYLVAKAKQRRPVGDWEFFPDWRDTLNV